MNCDDIQKGIYVYLDGEFAEPERLDFEGHVRGCAICRRKVERERVFLTNVKERLPAVSAPPGLDARIRKALAAEPLPSAAERDAQSGDRRPVPRWIWLAAAAVLIGTPLALVARGGGGPGSDAAPERVAREAVETHQEDLPMEVRGSHGHIRQFLEANVPFQVDFSLAEDSRVALVGARLTRVDGRDAVLLNYELDGDRLTVVQVADPGAVVGAGDEAPQFTSQKGFDVATFRKRGVVSSIVGAGGRGGVQRVVQAAWKLGQ